MNSRERWLRDIEDREERGETIDPRALYDEALERLDRVSEYGEQPHPRERREHRASRDELDARLALYPDRRRVDVINVTAADRRAA